MLDMFGGIGNFKVNGSKRNRARKESVFFFFFFFFFFKDIVSLAWYSYNSNIESLQMFGSPNFIMWRIGTEEKQMGRIDSNLRD